MSGSTQVTAFLLVEVALDVQVAVLLCTSPEASSDAFETGPLRGHASCMEMRWRFGLVALRTTGIDWLEELTATSEECTVLVSSSRLRLRSQKSFGSFLG